MAVLNVRLDEHVHDQLKELADEKGVSLSEYVRDLLLAEVLPVQHPETHGSAEAPQSMSIHERVILATLHRILGRVLPPEGGEEDGDLDHQLMLAKILEEGYSGEYYREVEGFSTELSRRDCDKVKDILEMSRYVTFSIERLAKDGAPVEPKLVAELQFLGFDYNDTLELHMATYAEYLIEGGRWQELKPQIIANGGYNSHSGMLAVYERMLAEYRRIMDSRPRGGSIDSYFLSQSELERIAAAQVHPSRR